MSAQLYSGSGHNKYYVMLTGDTRYPLPINTTITHETVFAIIDAQNHTSFSTETATDLGGYTVPTTTNSAGVVTTTAVDFDSKLNRNVTQTATYPSLIVDYDNYISYKGVAPITTNGVSQCVTQPTSVSQLFPSHPFPSQQVDKLDPSDTRGWHYTATFFAFEVFEQLSETFADFAPVSCSVLSMLPPEAAQAEATAAFATVTSTRRLAGTFAQPAASASSPPAATNNPAPPPSVSRNPPLPGSASSQPPPQSQVGSQPPAQVSNANPPATAAPQGQSNPPANTVQPPRPAQSSGPVSGALGLAAPAESGNSQPLPPNDNAPSPPTESGVVAPQQTVDTPSPPPPPPPQGTSGQQSEQSSNSLPPPQQGNSGSQSQPDSNPGSAPVAAPAVAPSNGQNDQGTSGSPNAGPGNAGPANAAPAPGQASDALGPLIASGMGSGSAPSNGAPQPEQNSPSQSVAPNLTPGNAGNQAAPGSGNAAPGNAVGGAPVLSAGGVVATGSAPQPVFVGNGVTIQPGQQATQVGGQTVSIAQGGDVAVVGDNTQRIGTAGTLTVGGAALTPVQGGPVFVIGGQTAAPGGPAITAAGNTISVAPGGSAAVVNGISQSVQGAPTRYAPAVPQITVGSQVLSANSQGVFTADGQTLSVGGSPQTIAGTPVSIGSSYAVVGGQTQALQPTVVPLSIGSTEVTPNAQGSYVIGSQTLTPGSVATLQGQTVSLASDGRSAAVGTSVQTLQPSDMTRSNSATRTGSTSTSSPSAAASPSVNRTSAGSSPSNTLTAGASDLKALLGLDSVFFALLAWAVIPLV
ncbi:MAG: hypothetical protein Q9162_004795 [Coniocarpon cinnabarinum]